MRLTHKLTLAIVFLVGVPVFLLGHFLFLASTDAIERQTMDHLMSVNQIKQSAFNRWLTNNEEQLELLAQRPLVREGLTTLVQEHREADGNPERAEAHELEHQRLLSDHLLPYIREGGLERILLLDPDSAEILLSTDRSIGGQFRGSEDYFVNGRRNTTTQNPYYSIISSKVMMTIATPVVSRTGELVAVLAGHLDLSEASEILMQGWDRTNSEDTYIVNQAGRFVTEPRFGENASLMRVAQSEGVEHALEGETGYGTYQDYRGVEVMGAYMWIPTRQLAILTEIDLAEAVGAVSRVRRTLIWVAGLAGVISIALGIFLARGLVKPAKLLVSATEQLGRGNLAHRVNVRSRDEIGKLGNAFNTMAENLSQITASRDELDEEVQARMAAAIELKHTIDALEQSELKFRLLTDASPVGVFIFKDMVLKYVNPMFAKIFGYSTDEIVDRLGPVDLTHPDDHETGYKYLDQCFAGIEGLSPHSFIGVRKDGSRLHCEARGRPIDYEGGIALLGTMVDVTERMKTQEDLRLKNTVFESSIAANSTTDVNGIITHVNASFLGLWGYAAKADVIGKPLSDLIADKEEAIVIVTALNKSGEWEGDFIALRKDGSTFISNGHATVLRNEDGDIVGYQSANIDVTKQRQSEADIRAAKEITDSIINSLPGVFYQISAEGRFVRWNAAFEKVTGYSGVEIEKMSPLDFFEDFEKEDVAEAIRRVFSEGYAEVTAGFRRKDGTTIPHYLTGTLKPLGGSPFLIGMGTDITSLLKAQAAVRESEEKFRALVETTSECIWEVDGDLQYTYVSPRITDLLGFEPDEVLGKTPFELMAPGEEERVRTELRDVIKDRRPFSGVENVNVRKDGVRVVLESSGQPIISPIGDLLGYRGIDRDITDRKVADDKLSELLEELEQFAYVASHDLQEPLRMVASYTQLLERRYKDAFDDDAREFIAFAVGGANRMQQLINDLLAFSRVQTRGKPFEPVDLNDVVDQARSNLAATINETAAIVTNDDLPIVMADARQMVSVFQNLIGNAIKFHGDEPPHISIEAEAMEDSWKISVSDNGIGIHPDFHDRIFVIFQRLHTRDEYPGTGIGLALCKRMIERHGGRIWIDSKVDMGTTFSFTIPKMNREAE